MKLALSSLPRSAPRRSGFTLLEVAIALAIFLIGALAIVRIFPGGLSVVDQSENQLRASDINKATLARLNADGAVPRSVFYGNVADPIAPNWTNFDGAVLGPTRPNKSLPASSQLNDLYDSALLDLVTVQGETAKVQLDTATTPASPYVLTQFPIAFDRDQPSSAVTTGRVNIFEEDELENVTTDGFGKLDLTKAVFKKSQQPFYNPTAATDADRVCTATASAGTDACMLYASYRFKEFPSVGTGYSGVTDEPVEWKGTISTPSNFPTTRAISISILGSAVPGIVRVRLRHLIGFKVFPDTTAPTTTKEDAHLGRVPLQTTYTLLTASSLSDLGQVTLDYSAGWGSYSLVEDIPSLTPQTQYSDASDPTNPNAPNATPGAYEAQIALNAPFTFARGTLPFCALVNDAGNISTVKFDGANKTPTTSNLLLKTDSQIAALPQDQQAIAYNERRYALRTGRISFDMTSNPAQKVRAAYATRDNWIQQLAVASSSYTRYPNAVSSGGGNATRFWEPWRDYVISTTDKNLYFHPSEAGKTIEVTYTDNNGSHTTVATIEQRLVNVNVFSSFRLPVTAAHTSDSSATPTNRVARLRLYKDDGTAVGGSLTGVQDVRGLSVSMRTAWLERDRWAQNITTTIRKDLP